MLHRLRMAWRVLRGTATAYDRRGNAVNYRTETLWREIADLFYPPKPEPPMAGPEATLTVFSVPTWQIYTFEPAVFAGELTTIDPDEPGNKH